MTENCTVCGKPEHRAVKRKTGLCAEHYRVAVAAKADARKPRPECSQCGMLGPRNTSRRGSLCQTCIFTNAYAAAPKCGTCSTRVSPGVVTCRPCRRAQLSVCTQCGEKPSHHNTFSTGLCFHCLHKKPRLVEMPHLPMNTVGKTIMAACRITLWKPIDIVGDDRSRPLMNVRHAVAYVARKKGLSYPQIGSVMRRDHTSIMNAVRRAEDLQARDKNFAGLVRAIEAAA